LTVGGLSLQPDQAALQCHGDCRGAVGDAQLAEDVDQMRFDRRLADMQAAGDIALRLPRAWCWFFG